MIKIARLLPRSTLWNIQTLQPAFCNSKPHPQPPKQKSYIMPQQPTPIPLAKPTQPLHFKNGRYLLYLNKQNLLTPFLLGLHYVIPLTYVGYLIAKNPFYLTFPAALPIMFIFQFVRKFVGLFLVLLAWVQHKALHKRQIERIYLLENGVQIQLVFANKIRRYVKNNEQNLMVNIADLFPKYDKQIAEGRVKHYPGVRFPADPTTQLKSAKMPNFLQYGWTFRDRIFNTYVLPAKFDYADWHLLRNVLNGIYVDVRDATSEGELKHGNFPPVEEEERNLEQRRKEQASRHK